MNRSIDELKIRAKKLQKRLNAGDPATLAALKLNADVAEDAKRRTCLNYIAKQIGFTDWNHAKITLSGMATPQSDMGKMWYGRKCTGMLNNWFADYREACEYHAKNPQMYLLPYKQQYMVVSRNFITAIGLDEGCEAYWKDIENNMVAHYGRNAWHEFVWVRVKNL